MQAGQPAAAETQGIPAARMRRHGRRPWGAHRGPTARRQWLFFTMIPECMHPIVRPPNSGDWGTCTAFGAGYTSIFASMQRNGGPDGVRSHRRPRIPWEPGNRRGLRQLRPPSPSGSRATLGSGPRFCDCRFRRQGSIPVGWPVSVRVTTMDSAAMARGAAFTPPVLDTQPHRLRGLRPFPNRGP